MKILLKGVDKGKIGGYGLGEGFNADIPLKARLTSTSQGVGPIPTYVVTEEELVRAGAKADYIEGLETLVFFESEVEVIEN